VFMALSADDEQVAAEAARRWFCRSLMGPRRLVWYSQGGEPVTDCRFVLARASAQQPDVLDIGHRGLAVAPDNPRHGRGAPVVACAHYFAEVDSPKWILCQDPAWVPANGELRYGAASPESARSWVLRRLTWNPDFTALVEELHRFLDETELGSDPRQALDRPGGAGRRRALHRPGAGAGRRSRPAARAAGGRGSRRERPSRPRSAHRPASRLRQACRDPWLHDRALPLRRGEVGRFLPTGRHRR
jgi:hypothetical protein